MQIATAAGRASPLDFEQVFGDLYPALVRRLALVVGDAEEAKDLAQTTYLRAYQHLRPVRWTGCPRMAVHDRPPSGVPGASASAAMAAACSELAPGPEPWQPAHDPALWDALRGLRREERAALLLNVVDGYTLAEIAGMLGVPPGTVASWVSRAKARLREQLGKE